MEGRDGVWEWGHGRGESDIITWNMQYMNKDKGWGIEG